MAKSKKKNVSWQRVHGPDLDKNKKDRENANKQTLENDFFKEMCSNAGVEPTKRQASKYRRNRGIAYRQKGMS